MRVRQKVHMLVMAVPDSQIPPWQAYVRVHDRYKKMVRQDASGSRGRIMISASLLLPATGPKKHHREVCTQSKWYNIASEAKDIPGSQGAAKKYYKYPAFPVFHLRHDATPTQRTTSPSPFAPIQNPFRCVRAWAKLALIFCFWFKAKASLPQL